MSMRRWSWLLLCVLAKARQTVDCPSSESAEVGRFNIYCTTADPCHNVDVHCSSSSHTNLLWLDCNGAHSCENVTVYSGVSSRVRCRGRTGACENVSVYCGSIKDEKDTGEGSMSLLQANQNRDPISCKFTHFDARVSQNTFFGCYGDIQECTSTAMVDSSYSDSEMLCQTTNGTPCIMQCRTPNSCMNNEIECKTLDSHLCQCNPTANCNNVRIITLTTTTSTPGTTNTKSTTTVAPDTSSSSVTSTESTTETLTQTSSTLSGTTSTTNGETTSTTIGETTSTTIGETTSTTIGETTSTTIGKTTSTTIGETTSTTGGETTSTTSGETSTSTSTTSGETSTQDTTTTQSENVTSTLTSTFESTYGDNKNLVPHNTKETGVWKIVVIVVLSIIAAALAAFAIGFALRQWKKQPQSSLSVQLDDEESQLNIFAPPGRLFDANPSTATAVNISVTAGEISQQRNNSALSSVATPSVDVIPDEED